MTASKSETVLATWQTLHNNKSTTRIQRVVACAVVRDRAPRNDRELKSLAATVRSTPKAVSAALGQLRDMTGVDQ